MKNNWLTKTEITNLTGISVRILQRVIAGGKCRYHDKVITHVMNHARSTLVPNYIDERYNLASHKGHGMDNCSPGLAWQDKLGNPLLRPAKPAVPDLLMMAVDNAELPDIRSRIKASHTRQPVHLDRRHIPATPVTTRLDATCHTTQPIKKAHGAPPDTLHRTTHPRRAWANIL